MKHFILLVLLVPVILGMSACKKKSNEIVYDRKYIKEIKAFRKEAVTYLVSNNIPGGSVAVIKNGKLIYSEGMGYASKDLNVAATRKTKFRIGNLTECFTSVMYEMMVEKGTLHPDSTVQYYLPDFPQLNYKLTIKHLPYHTSGIREPNDKEADWRGLNISLQEGIDNFKGEPLLYQPGTMQRQSIYNYNLLGAVMEKATGKNFSELLKTYLTDPLQLTNTVPDNPYAIIKDRTDFFDQNYVAQLVNAASRDMRYKAPSEGLLSNAEDLVKFGNAILESKIISDGMKADLFKPIILYDNLPSAISKGWMVMTTNDGKRFYGRSGGVAGGSASLVIFPDEKLVIAATTNLTDNIGQIPIMLFASKFLPVQGEIKN